MKLPSQGNEDISPCMLNYVRSCDDITGLIADWTTSAAGGQY